MCVLYNVILTLPTIQYKAGIKPGVPTLLNCSALTQGS